jgi:hypothetical protein
MWPPPNEDSCNSPAPAPNPFSGADVENVLRERGWLGAETSPEQSAWCGRAAALLGSHAADRDALSELLGLVFHYHAPEILARIETHALLSRKASRDVLRQLARQLLDPLPLTSDRFSEIITAMKLELHARGRDLFHPLRLALAGRSGEGDLDRGILLLDEAGNLEFRSTREKRPDPHPRILYRPRLTEAAGKRDR